MPQSALGTKMANFLMLLLRKESNNSSVNQAFIEKEIFIAGAQIEREQELEISINSDNLAAALTKDNTVEENDSTYHLINISQAEVLGNSSAHVVPDINVYPNNVNQEIQMVIEDMEMLETSETQEANFDTATELEVEVVQTLNTKVNSESITENVSSETHLMANSIKIPEFSQILEKCLRSLTHQLPLNPAHSLK
jgi:hypothetical protein